MLEKQCRNLLHAEWVNQYSGCDSDISTLKRVKVSERNAYEKFVLGETFKCQFVNFAWICCTLCIPIRLLTLKRPLCLNALETPKRPKRRRLLDIPDNIDQEISSEPDIAGMGEGEFQKIVFEVGQRLQPAVH